MKYATSPLTKKGRLTTNQDGFSLIEVILASAVFVLLVTAFTGAYLYGEESTALSGNRMRANLIAEEGLEAVRNIRDAGFGNLSDGTHGLAVSGNQWAFSGSRDTVDIFTRQITVSSVDAKRKKVTSEVSWQQNAQRTGIVSLTTRFTNWAKPVANWSAPTSTGFDLTVPNSGNADADGQVIAFSGNRVYLARTNSAGSEFYIFDVSNPDSPLLIGQRDLNGEPNDVAINGNYAYIASTDNSSELQVIDVSDPSTIQNADKLTTVDLAVANSGVNNANTTALAVSGDYLYVLRNGGDELLIFDLANPANPGDPIGRESNVSGVPHGIVVSGNYAYIVSGENSAELQVVDVTAKTAPSRVATLNLNSGNDGADAVSIALVGSYVLIGRNQSAAPELYAVSIATPTAPSLSSTLELGAGVLSIDYDPATGYAFLITNDNAADFKVVDASSPASLGVQPPFGQLNIADSPQDLVYDSGLNRVFIASSNNSEEMDVIRPQ